MLHEQLISGFNELDLNKVREHSSAEERCGPHVAISPVMLQSSNESPAGPQATKGGPLPPGRNPRQMGAGNVCSSYAVCLRLLPAVAAVCCCVLCAIIPATICCVYPLLPCIPVALPPALSRPLPPLFSPLRSDDL